MSNGRIEGSQFVDLALFFFLVFFPVQYVRSFQKNQYFYHFRLLLELEVIGSEQNGDVAKIFWSVKYPFPFTNRDYVYKRFAKARFL